MESPGRIWLDVEGDLLVRFKSSKEYRETNESKEIRDTDGIDEEHTFYGSEKEIQVKPMFNFKPEISWPIRSFDLGGSELGGYPKVAACACQMHAQLLQQGHHSSVLIQLWSYTESGDKVQWQVEYRGQGSLAIAQDVAVMRSWVEAGAPLAFIARLTGNDVDRLEMIVKPTSQAMGQVKSKPAIEVRKTQETAWK